MHVELFQLEFQRRFDNQIFLNSSLCTKGQITEKIQNKDKSNNRK